MDRERMYQAVGKATHLSQVLELNITVLISIVNRSYGLGIDKDQIIIADDRKTLGRLIDELRKVTGASQNTVDALKAALDARNWVAHHFFVRNTEAFTSDAACTSALATLEKRTKEIALAGVLTEGFARSLCERLGIKFADVLIEQDT